MSTLLNDLRIACRQLGRKPMFTATAVLTLAIGMGVNGVAFSVVNGLLFKRSSTSAHPELGRVITTPGSDEGGNASIPDFERFADATRGALELAAEGRSTLAWHHDGTTETAWVLFVSPNYFSMVDARVIAGRLDVSRTAGNLPAVVIGERFWREKLGARSIAGLTLRLNAADVSVAGVLPEAFTGPAGLYSPDVWLPIEEIAAFGTSPQLRARDTRWLFLLGKLHQGANAAEVEGRLNAAAVEMARDWPDSHRDRGARFRLFTEHSSELRGIAAGATIGMGIIGLVLLLACFNVANLLLARAVERQRDMGIRAALGATPSRLMRLVVTEGFVIAGLAGAVALVIAWWTQSLVASFAIPIEEPQHLDLTPDLNVALFIAALVLIAGVLPGLWPAIAAARVNVLRVLGSQGANAATGRPSPLRRWLVGAQIAGSTAFLALAALLAQSYLGLTSADYGFDKDHLVVAQFDPASHGLDADQSQRYIDGFLSRVRALPGVAAAAAIDHAPFFVGFDRLTPVWPEHGTCADDKCPKVATLAAGPGYFQAMGVTMVAGHEFEPGGGTDEVVVNQPFAKQQWPDGRGLGETFSVSAGASYRVVGITAKTHTRGLDREPPTIYLRLGAHAYQEGITLVARTTVAPSTLVRSINEAAHIVDPNVSMHAVKTMEQQMAVQLWPFRTVSWMFTICGSLALILATVGLTAVVIHAVNQRLREFGVRVSLGATPRDLIGDVLGSSAFLLLPGLAIGVLLAGAVARLLQYAFFGVNVLNPLVYSGVALFECATVCVACIGPALRASRVDPLVALRSE